MADDGRQQNGPVELVKVRPMIVPFEPEEEEPADSRRPLIYWLGGGIFVSLALVIFLVLKAYAASPIAGDENIYFYVGKRVLEGALPYRDVFLAHPTGHLIIAMIWMIPGYLCPFWGKLAAIFPAAILLVMLMVLTLRMRLGVFSVGLMGLLLATSLNYLTISSHFTGANWSNLWLISGLLALALRRRAMGGSLLALAGLTSFHLLPAVIGIIFLELWLSKKLALRSIALLFFVTALGHEAGWFVAGSDFIEQVFGYHLMKTAMSGGGASSLIRFFHCEYLLWAPALLGSVALVLRAFKTDDYFDSDEGRLFAFSLSGALFQFVALLVVQRVYTYYLAPLLPLFAILSLYFYRASFAYLAGIWQAIRSGESFKIKLVVTAVFLSALVVSCVFGEMLEREMGYYKREYGKIATYKWKDSEFLPGFVNDTLRSLLFREKRLIGDFDLKLTRYFWHEFVSSDPSPLLQDLEKYKDREGTLFGDASTTAYFALITGRNIAMDQADTNIQIFRSGLRPIDRMLAELELDPPAFIIGCPRKGIYSTKEFRAYVNTHYQQVSRRKIGKKRELLLFERR